MSYVLHVGIVPYAPWEDRGVGEMYVSATCSGNAREAKISGFRPLRVTFFGTWPEAVMVHVREWTLPSASGRSGGHAVGQADQRLRTRCPMPGA